ncbi:MAG TPA: phage holin family protein [Bryobacteraceae bacterium]|nr:phage holin family protein [Bryobacteraceae bacterium]
MIERTANPAFTGKLIIGLVGAQLMKIPHVVVVLLVFTVIDYATGLLVAWQRKSWSSDVGRKGLIKKASTFILILTLGALQQMLVAMKVPGFEESLGVFAKLDVVNVLSFLYILNEVISIIENCAGVGVPIPARIVQALVAAKKYQMRSATAAELAELAKADGQDETSK